MAFVQPKFNDGNFQEVLRAANGPRAEVPYIIKKNCTTRSFT